MSADFSFTLVNPATSGASIYQGVAATLNATLTNNTGGAVTLTSNSTGPSTMEIFLPGFFTWPQTQAMTISLQNWTFSPNDDDQSLMLTYSGPDQAAWNTGTSVAFAIGNVEATAAPTSDQVQVNFNNMAGNVPTQVTCPISLSAQPMPGNANLSDVLQVSLENQGTVYVSQAGDPLPNTLFLNFKNIGGAPIYSGTSLWIGNPQVIIEFVYGLTAGSLAQDNDRANPGVGSAWNIGGAVEVSEGNSWGVSNPSTTGQDAHPKWILTPSSTNLGIIGTGDSANILFNFTQVISMTPIGATQMIVHFSGFAKDANTLYDDAVFVLQVSKYDPPPQRGLINFYSPQPTLTVTDPGPTVPVSLFWSAYQVDSVQLNLEGNPAPLLTRNYDSQGVPPILEYDRAVVQLRYADIMGDPPNKSAVVTFALSAYGGTGIELDSQTYQVTVNGLWGGLEISATPATTLVYDPQATLSFDINWTTFETGSIVLSWSAAGSQPADLFSTTYPHAILTRPGQFQAQIPYSAIAGALGMNQSGQVTFTLACWDVNGNPLQAITCNVAIEPQLFLDPRDNQVYPTLKSGATLWMAHNLDWDAGSNSAYAGGDPSLGPILGRLYSAGALGNVPEGWRLPTPQDWTNLFQAFTTGPGYNGPYTCAALLEGGSSGFNVPVRSGSGGLITYWDTGGSLYIWSDGGCILVTYVIGPLMYLRYVKDL